MKSPKLTLLLLAILAISLLVLLQQSDTDNINFIADYPKEVTFVSN